MHRERAKEIAENALSWDGEAFWCHKTTYAGTGKRGRVKHCAGSAIFSERHGVVTQALRIGERLGVYDPAKLQGHDRVFETTEEMVNENNE